MKPVNLRTYTPRKEAIDDAMNAIYNLECVVSDLTKQVRNFNHRLYKKDITEKKARQLEADVNRLLERLEEGF